MKNAIIIHGMPSKEEYESLGGNFRANQHWLPWLEKKLIERGVDAHTAEMPIPYEPQYELWKDVFEKYKVDNETILVGHSCGGGFLIRYLSENKIPVGQVVLVAPWTDPEKELNTGFFDFTIDSDLISRTQGLIVMYSVDDDPAIIKTVDELKSIFPNALFKEYSGMGHFTLEDMGTMEFPELLNLLRI
jgi:predicted alpha/beta hydrolase family esterase